MSRRRCLCRCHEGGHGDRMRADGVHILDPVEAIVACTDCRRYHNEAIEAEPHVDVVRPDAVTDNGKCTPPRPPSLPFLPPRPWSKQTEDGD